MDESVQKHLENAGLDPALLEKLKQGGKDNKERRYAWRFWKSNNFCPGCLFHQPLSFKEVLRRHDFWDTGIAADPLHTEPGRPYPLDPE